MVPVTFVRNGKQDETRVKAQRSSFHQTSPPNTALVDPPVDKELYQKGAREKDEIAEIDGKVITTQNQADADLRSKPGKAVILKLRRREMPVSSTFLWKNSQNFALAPNSLTPETINVLSRLALERLGVPVLTPRQEATRPREKLDFLLR